jgi:hypothetical protein
MWELAHVCVALHVYGSCLVFLSVQTDDDGNTAKQQGNTAEALRKGNTNGKSP